MNSYRAVLIVQTWNSNMQPGGTNFEVSGFLNI